MENAFGALISRLNSAEERISEPEDIAIRILENQMAKTTKT